MAMSKRSMNWSPTEKLKAIELIVDRQTVLFGKFKGVGGGLKAKEAAWQEIADQLNASGVSSCNRSAVEIKKMFHNTKSRAKEKHDLRQKTGGGPAVQTTPAEEYVLQSLETVNCPSLSGLGIGIDTLQDAVKPDGNIISIVVEEETIVPCSEDEAVTKTCPKQDVSSAKIVPTRKRIIQNRECVLYDLEEKKIKLEIRKLEEEIESILLRRQREEELHNLQKKSLLNKLNIPVGEE